MGAVDPIDALQKGIYDLLTGDVALATLATIVGGGRAGVEPPYVSFGGFLSLPGGVHGAEGREVLVTLDTWTRAESFVPGNAIGSRLVALLWHRHVELDALVTGHRVWRVDHEFMQNVVDPEPGIRHRIDRFRIWTGQD